MRINQRFNNSKFFVRIPARRRFIAACIFLAIVCFFGAFAVAGYGKVDMGRWLGQCGFKQEYSLPCPTCGMTTAVLTFAQGDVIKAFYIQPAAGLLCMLIVAIAVLAFIAAVFGVYFQFVARFFSDIRARHIILALLIIILAGWAVTLARALAAK